MHRFRDMTTYWLKIAEKPTPPSFGTFLWGDPLEFFDDSYLAETRIMGLSDGVQFTILLSLCQAQYRVLCLAERKQDREMYTI